MSQLIRFLLGGGWWTLWYLFFYLFTGAVNIAWFEELLQMVQRKENGPGNGAAYIGLISMSGLPMLLFSCIHLFLGVWNATDSRPVLIGFSFAFLALVLCWMFLGTAAVAEATYTGFAIYYLGYFLILFINLALLWITRYPARLLFWL